jgi:hypothetical protein
MEPATVTLNNLERQGLLAVPAAIVGPVRAPVVVEVHYPTGMPKYRAAR